MTAEPSVTAGPRRTTAWTPSTPSAASPTQGVQIFEVTAIDRDGLLGGPDLDALRATVALDRGAIIASGGITSLADLVAVRGTAVRGAIIGRALDEGRLSLRDAMASRR